MIATLIQNGTRLRIEVHAREGFTETELATHKKACEALEEVVNSEVFKQMVLSTHFTSTNGLSNQQILDRIYSGADNINTASDGDIDVHVIMYHKANRTVGYTYPDTHKTWVNRKFYGDVKSIAANIAHEAMHKIGFDHSSASEHTSVPYAIGSIIEVLIDRELEVEPKQKVWVCYRSWRSLWLRQTCEWV